MGIQENPTSYIYIYIHTLSKSPGPCAKVAAGAETASRPNCRRPPGCWVLGLERFRSGGLKVGFYGIRVLLWLVLGVGVFYACSVGLGCT